MKVRDSLSLGFRVGQGKKRPGDPADIKRLGYGRRRTHRKQLQVQAKVEQAARYEQSSAAISEGRLLAGVF
jgi:hypothetical protein